MRTIAMSPQRQPIDGVGFGAFVRAKARLDVSPDRAHAIRAELGLTDEARWKSIEAAWLRRADDAPAVRRAYHLCYEQEVEALRGQAPQVEAPATAEVASTASAGSVSDGAPFTPPSTEVPSYLRASPTVPAASPHPSVSAPPARPLALPDAAGGTAILAPPPESGAPPASVLPFASSPGGAASPVGDWTVRRFEAYVERRLAVGAARAAAEVGLRGEHDHVRLAVHLAEQAAGDDALMARFRAAFERLKAPGGGAVAAGPTIALATADAAPVDVRLADVDAAGPDSTLPPIRRSGPAMPFASECAGETPEPRLRLEEYAAFLGELARDPSRAGILRAKYAILGEDAQRALGASFAAKFQADPSLRARFDALLAAARGRR